MIDILLMFGPCHGKTFQISEQCNRTGMVLAVEDAHVRADFRYNMQLDIFNRNDVMMVMPKRHMYHRAQEYQTENGEDCVLYVHDSRCCEKGMNDVE